MKTLIVEDDLTSRLFLQQILQVYGVVHIAVNGKEALEAVKIALQANEPYDIICLDIMMPEMDGHVALKKIRALEEEEYFFPVDGTKIIITSMLKDIKNVSKAFNEMCDYYMSKPIEKQQLIEQLKKFKLID